MKIVYGNLWDHPGIKVIPTNGMLRSDGQAIMGSGAALEARVRYPDVPRVLGFQITLAGNIVHYLPTNSGTLLMSFPTKHDWKGPSNLQLIRESALLLARYAEMSRRDYVLPRPGCGYGQLLWEDVCDVILPILPDNVYVITNEIAR